jgi:hypothetical protein
MIVKKVELLGTVPADCLILFLNPKYPLFSRNPAGSDEARGPLPLKLQRRSLPTDRIKIEAIRNFFVRSE